MKNKIIKTIAIGMAIMLGTASAAFAVSVPPDVQGEPYEEAVRALMEIGAITGDVDGKYHPEEELTRAQICKIIVSTINPPMAEVTGSATQTPYQADFSDMENSSWALPYVNYAAANGIIKGYPDGTFKPRDSVTVAELDAMLVRACKVAESELSGEWPENYVNKAAEMGFYDDTGLVDLEGSYYSGTATKWMAAWMTYNAMDEIKAANVFEKDPQGTSNDKATTVPSMMGMKYTKAAQINKDITEFHKIPLSSNIKVYTYGKRSDYSESMVISKKPSDYRLDTIYKYKSVVTPAWYKTENGKVTEIILPNDVGYTGRAIGIATEYSTTLNYDGSVVPALETLTAGKTITWQGKTRNLAGLTPESVATAKDNGDIIELKLSQGQCYEATIGAVNFTGFMVEHTTTNAWEKVTNVDSKYLIWTQDSALIDIADNAVFYIYDNMEKTYYAGSFDDILVDDEIRCYDISDDDNNQANIVVVKPDR